MKEKRLSFYGYEKATYEDCHSLISSMNNRHVEILNLWFIIITAIYLFFSWNNSYGFSRENSPLFFIFLICEVVFEMGLLRFNAFMERYSGIFIRINMISLLLFGIICSLAQPYMAGNIYLVMLILVALSFITMMFEMIGILGLASGFFLFASYQIKPGTIFNQDVFNVLIVLMLAIVLHYTFQRARIRQFITYRKSEKMQHELEIKSSFDALTSLLNRGRFFSMADEALRQNDNENIAIAILDLDKFKQINDSLGHQMGDKVLQLASKTILETLDIDYGDKWSFPERAIKEHLNFAGRLGGDEFVVLIRDFKDEEEIRTVFGKILDSLNNVSMTGLDGIHASIGVTKARETDRDLDSIYTRADEALYVSKQSGRNMIHVQCNHENEEV